MSPGPNGATYSLVTTEWRREECQVGGATTTLSGVRRRDPRRGNPTWRQTTWGPSGMPHTEEKPPPEDLGTEDGVEKSSIASRWRLSRRPAMINCFVKTSNSQSGGGSLPLRGRMTPSVQSKLNLLAANVMDGMPKCRTFHVLTNCRKSLMPHRDNERGHPVRSDPCEELWLVRAPVVRAAGREMSVKHHRVKQGTDKSLGDTRDHSVVKRGCRGW